jgi:hypothetical protein
MPMVDGTGDETVHQTFLGCNLIYPQNAAEESNPLSDVGFFGNCWKY